MCVLQAGKVMRPLDVITIEQGMGTSDFKMLLLSSEYERGVSPNVG